MADALKQCTRCAAFKPLLEFNKHPYTKTKTASWCKVCSAQAQRARCMELRNRIFELYGNKCNWPGCNWTDKLAFCIDHVNGDGYKDQRAPGRRKTGSMGRVPGMLKILKTPKNYQLLCANHNMIKAKIIDPQLRKLQAGGK